MKFVELTERLWMASGLSPISVRPDAILAISETTEATVTPIISKYCTGILLLSGNHIFIAETTEEIKAKIEQAENASAVQLKETGDLLWIDVASYQH